MGTYVCMFVRIYYVCMSVYICRYDVMFLYVYVCM